MTKKIYKIKGIEINNLIEICKRDGNAPGYIEYALNEILPIANNLGSVIKLHKLHKYIIEKRNIRKEKVENYYDYIIKTLDKEGEVQKELREASEALKYFLERLREEKVVF